MKRAVIDQAGLKIIFTGLMVSLFFGLIFKSQIRSSVVSERLQKTLDVLKRDLVVDFDSAQVKLSDWGLPRPTVEISGLRLSPVIQNCQNNQIYIEKLSIPLNLKMIFSKNKKDQGINTLRASLIEIRLDRIKDCFSRKEAASAGITAEKAARVENSPNTNSKNETQNSLNQFFNQSTALKEMSIDRLRIIAPDIFKLPVDLNAVQLSIESDGRKIRTVDLQAQMLSFKDATKNFFLLKSEINLKAKTDAENDQIDIKMNANVLLIDRPFVFDIRYDQKKNSLEYIGEIKNVSVKAFIQMYQLLNSQKLNIKTSALGFAALSGFMSGEFFLDADKKDNSNLIFKNIQVIANTGLVTASEIYFYNLNDGQFRPFDVYFNNLNVSDMFGLSSDHRLNLSFAEGGYISGSLSFLSQTDIRLKALVEKSQLAFSNQGKPATQTFDSYNLSGFYKPHIQSLQINDLVRGENKIKGYIKYNQNNSSKELDVNLSGLIFSEDIFELYIGERQQTEMSLKLQTDLVTVASSQIDFKTIKYKNILLSNPTLILTKDLSKNENLVLVDSKGQYVQAEKILNFRLSGEYSGINKTVNAQLFLSDEKVKKYSVTGLISQPNLAPHIESKK